MSIFLHRLIKEPLLWAFLIMLTLQYFANRIYGDKEHVPVLAAAITGSIVMFGYFATHHLTQKRALKDRKFDQCLELVKKIRFFIIEKNIVGTDQHFKMRDELQDAYFAFSLLTSAKGYEALSEMMNAFEAHLNQKDKERLDKFTKAQSNFVNKLRKEFFIDNKIDFKTYDFQLKKNDSEKT